MIHSAVILCGFLLAGFAAPAMAETEQTEAATEKVHQQEEQKTVQQLSDKAGLDPNDTLSDPSGSDPENVTCSCPKLIPPGYRFRKGLGYYKLHTAAANWHNAKATCEREGAYLAIINSKDEANFINNIRLELKLQSYNLGTYVGIHDLLDEGMFFTIFGQPLNETGYAVWYPGDPKGDAVSKTYDCIILNLRGTFQDYSCDVDRLFACELWQ